MHTAGLLAQGELALKDGGDSFHRARFSQIVLDQRFALGPLSLSHDKSGWHWRIDGGSVSRLFTDSPQAGADGKTASSVRQWRLADKGPLHGVSFDPGWTEPVDGTFRLRKLDLGHGKPLRELQGGLSYRQGGWQRLYLVAKTDAAGELRVDFLAGREDREQILIFVRDLGEILRSLGVFDEIDGAELYVGANVKGPDHRISGQLIVDRMRVHNAPLLVKLMTLASLTGPLELLLTNNGLRFDVLQSDFSYYDGKLAIQRGHAFSDALGVTTTGTVDLRGGPLKLRGTMAPAFLFSQILETIPILSQVMTPRQEGLFAIGFNVGGTVNKPDVTTNPLTTLVPGVLRDIIWPAEETPSLAYPAVTEGDKSGGDKTKTTLPAETGDSVE